MIRSLTFTGPEIRAMLSGAKVQHRVVLKPQPHGLPAASAEFIDGRWCWLNGFDGSICGTFIAPLAPGDVIAAKEAFNVFTFSEDGEAAWPPKSLPTEKEYRETVEAAYRFDMQVIYQESDRARKWFTGQPWRSPVTMPRWASRLTLTVDAVKVERVQGISEADARAEGADPNWRQQIHPSQCAEPRCDGIHYGPIWHFHDMWTTRHGPDAWARNDWVCAATFTAHHMNVDEYLRQSGG